MRLRFLIVTARLFAVLAVSQLIAHAEQAPTQEQIEGTIARVTGELMQKVHFAHHKLDAEMSAKMFDRYIDTLDPLHLHFLQTDLQEFEKYRTTLGALITKGDTKPAHVIFDRFLQRVEQRN